MLVAIAGVLALMLIRKTADPDFWVAGAGALVPIVLTAAGKVGRPVNTPSISELDEQATILAEMVLPPWEAEVQRRTSFYPLPVPFSAATQVTATLTVKNAAGEQEARELTVGVMDSWTAILGDPDRQPPSIDGTYNSITGVFKQDGLPSRLVVLGEAGSGKSILAQELTVGLLKARQADDAAGRPGKAIPVLLSLSTWDPAVPLRDWAAVQMVRLYPRLGRELQGKEGAQRTLADWLLDQRRVLLVLDGLDEVSRENQREAFRKLSEAASTNQAMVVTCRTTEYAQIVYDAKRQPMPKTPVIRLRPLPLTLTDSNVIIRSSHNVTSQVISLCQRLRKIGRVVSRGRHRQTPTDTDSGRPRVRGLEQRRGLTWPARAPGNGSNARSCASGSGGCAMSGRATGLIPPARRAPTCCRRSSTSSS